MKLKHWIRQSLFLVWITCLAHAEVLPTIDVHQATVVPVEISKTGRIYRFKMDANELPHPGKIILIQEKERPIMAFRVLQTDEATGEWIGKRVRRYDTERALDLKVPYDSIEKISDLVAPPPPEMKYDVNAKPELGAGKRWEQNPTPAPPNPDAPPELDPLPDVQEPSAAESSEMEPLPEPGHPMDVNQYDEELDAGTAVPPPPKPGPEESFEEEEAPLSSHEPQENVILNPYEQTISVTLDSFRNMSGFTIHDQSKSSNSGFAVNYAMVVDRGVWTRSKTLQDSLVFEAGFGYYSRVNFSGTQDAYTISPLKAELQYQLHPSKTFSVFGYVGLQYNWIFSSDTENTSAAQVKIASEALGGIQHTLGAGLYYNIGPQWYLRADVGWDRMGIGLAVKW